MESQMSEVEGQRSDQPVAADAYVGIHVAERDSIIQFLGKLSMPVLSPEAGAMRTTIAILQGAVPVQKTERTTIAILKDAVPVQKPEVDPPKESAS